MPLVVPSDELRPGMALFEPILNNGRIMMQSGRPLSEKEIEVIRRRYPGISVRVGDPVLDNVVEFEDDSAERKVADAVQQKVSGSMSQVQKRFSDRTSLKHADFDALNEAVREIMNFLRDNPVSTALVSQCLDSNTFLSTHTGNVFYLSMLLGSTVLSYVVNERKRRSKARGMHENFAMDLTPMGLGVLVMDLGLLPYQQVFSGRKPPTAEEWEQIRQHPQTGADMLPDNFSAVSRMIVRSHHENLEGTGYPAGLKEDKVHIFARIVRIADAYAAATSEGVFAESKSPSRVLWEMLIGPHHQCFDSRLTTAFAQLIQPFAIGSKLRLEDGRYGVVVRHNRTKPFKPIVIIAYDENNNSIPHEKLDDMIDLSQRKDVRIKSFRGEDLSYLHAPATQEYEEKVKEFRSLLDVFYP